MFLGTAGVGKTSFKRSLMKLPWEPNTTSTVVSDISSIRPFTHEWHTQDKGQWRTVTHEDEIEELAQLISAVHFESDSITSESEPKSSFHRSFLAKFKSFFILFLSDHLVKIMMHLVKIMRPLIELMKSFLRLFV